MITCTRGGYTCIENVYTCTNMCTHENNTGNRIQWS